MKMSFRITVNVGPRSETWVEVYGTAVNKKTATLTNGVKISDEAIAKWIEDGLLEALQKLESEAPKGEQNGH